MNKRRSLILPKLILILIICFMLISPTQAGFAEQTAPVATSDTTCRFGINSALGSEGYDIAGLGVGSYLDWGAITNPILPPGVEYIRVLRVRNDIYLQTLANLPGWVEGNPGAVWIVGNEPDTTYENQDALLPEVYADRYYELATIIRNKDSSAKIGFGSIVQPSPIRIRYLSRAWNQLSVVAGNSLKASSLIDFWAIHSFILNEQQHRWGTGVPPGFENDDGDAFIIDPAHLYYTYSITIFQQRIFNFREWMNTLGERGKPLWITEYGSLFPPIDPAGGPDYVNVSDEDTAEFMLKTFDFLLSAADDQTGLSMDGNHLVQRWFWYSLNQHRYKFGGTAFDPDNNKLATLVGEEFINYQSLDLAEPDLFPINISAAPLTYNHDRTRVNYRLDLKVGNALTADTNAKALVRIYDGDPSNNGTLIAGPIQSTDIQRCGGIKVVTAAWNNVQPLTYHTLYVIVEPIGVSDSNPENNEAAYTIFLDVPKVFYLPNVYR